MTSSYAGSTEVARGNSNAVATPQMPEPSSVESSPSKSLSLGGSSLSGSKHNATPVQKIWKNMRFWRKHSDVWLQQLHG